MGEAAADVVMVVVPFPAQGHLNQLLHFCRLVAATDIPVHFIGSPTHNRQAKHRLHGWDVKSYPTLQFHDFPLPPFPTPPPNPAHQSAFPSHLQPAFNASLHLRPHLALLLRSLSSTARRVVVVHDSLMSFAAVESAALPNTETYAFHSVSAFANVFFQWEKRGVLLEKAKDLYSFQGISIPSSKDCFTEEFIDFIRSQHRLTAADDGRLINTCRPIEDEFINLFSKEPLLKNKRLFAIGPLNPIVFGVKQRRHHECLDWLDQQPPSSVLYVSFGTTSSLSCRQVDELAEGLRRSGHRFLWVLRDADRGDIFAAESGRGGEVGDGHHHQPGFWDCGGRKWGALSAAVAAAAGGGQGMMVRGWAPQLEILAHPATAGFMSHCGWNSCMESMSMGVAMLAWPMHSDQPRNTVMVTEVLRVGVAVRDWERRTELVRAEAVEAAVSRLMGTEEGKRIRRRAKELGAEVRRAVSESGGSSRKEVEDFIRHITRP